MNEIPSVLLYAVLLSVGVALLFAGGSILFKGRMPGPEVMRLSRPVGLAFVIAGVGVAGYTALAFIGESDGKRRRQADEWARYHAATLAAKAQGLDLQVVLLRVAPQSEVAAQKQRVEEHAREVEELSALCERKAEGGTAEVREEIGREVGRARKSVEAARLALRGR